MPALTHVPAASLEACCVPPLVPLLADLTFDDAIDNGKPWLINAFAHYVSSPVVHCLRRDRVHACRPPRPRDAAAWPVVSQPACSSRWSLFLQCQLTHEMDEAFEAAAQTLHPGTSVGRVRCFPSRDCTVSCAPQRPAPAVQIDGSSERGLMSRFQLRGFHAVYHINGTQTRVYCEGHACEGQRIAQKQARKGGKEGPGRGWACSGVQADVHRPSVLPTAAGITAS